MNAKTRMANLLAALLLAACAGTFNGEEGSDDANFASAKSGDAVLVLGLRLAWGVGRGAGRHHLLQRRQAAGVKQ